MKKRKLPKYAFLVALHVLNEKQVMTEVKKILQPGGAHGVLLVNHDGKILSRKGASSSGPDLFTLAQRVKDEYPKYLVGVNPLDLSTKNALSIIQGYPMLDILWTDKGGLEESDYLVTLPIELRVLISQCPAIYFGSDLFKYQPERKNPKAIARLATEQFNVFVTSGEATGVSPGVEKIKQIREWVGKKPKIAVASGMDYINVVEFMPYADIFIVGTSVCIGDGTKENFFYYDEEKILRFRARLASLQLVTQII